MKNFRLTVDLQFDCESTASVFAKVLSKTMQLTAKTTVDNCEDTEARVILGKTTIASAETFEANR